MNTKEVAFVAVTVFFRTGAIAVLLYAVFELVTTLAVMGLGLPPVVLRMLAVEVIAAVALWRLAKPLARLVVSGLDSEPRS